MNVTLAIETELLQRLTKALTLPGMAHPKVDVAAWPDRPKDFKLQHPHGCALLMYKRSQYQSCGTSGQWARGTSEFEITLAARTLREPQIPADSSAAPKGLSAYALVDTCKWALSGFRPTAASSALMLADDSFEQYFEGVWYYSLRVSVPVIAITGRDCAPGPWVAACCLDAPALARVAYVDGPSPQTINSFNRAAQST